MKTPRSSLRAAAAIFALLAAAFGAQTADRAPTPGRQASASPSETGEPTPSGESVRLDASTTEYLIRASVFILGDLGTVGSMKLERDLERQNGDLVKTFRVSGRTKPELIKKGRDIGGEFTTVTRRPIDGAADPASDAAGDDRETGTYYTGVLEKNGVAKGEKVVFYPAYALSTKTDGTEKRISGRFESLLAGFEFFLENPIRRGEVYESKFILDGYPYIFKCEAGGADYLEEFGVKAFRVDVTTYDGILRDYKGKPVVVKKKGGIRLWLCKDEPYKNVILKMKLQYKWYLGLVFELTPAG